MTGHKQEAKEVLIQAYPLTIPSYYKDLSDSCWKRENTIKFK